MKLLKSGVELPYAEEVKAITRGDWTARLSAYRSIFGAVPSDLTSRVATLEKIRRLRNDFAHGFGASVASLTPTAQAMLSKQRLAQRTFISHIAAISKVAAVIDADLLGRYIGSFEVIYYYHTWKSGPVDPRDRKYDVSRRFKRSVIRDMRCEVGPRYCDDLITYYDGV